MREIPLTRGAIALVDNADWPWLSKWKWYLSGTGYAMRSDYVGHRRSRYFYMHRIILGLATGDRRECDHINRDRLDNRRTNLRIVTRAEQQQNVPARGGSSRHRGVHWDRQRQKWFAQGSVRGKRIALGRFESEDEAGAAARAFRAEHMPLLPAGDR